MDLVAGKLNNTFLQDVVQRHLNDCAEVIAVVPYCNSTRLFELCKKAGKRVTYYGRLDDSVPVASPVLKWFLSQQSTNFSCYLLRGGLHAKIIWLKGEGVYIGSANLTDRGWMSNIEAGVFIAEEDLATQGIDDQLSSFVHVVKENSTPLSEEILAMVKKLEERHRKLLGEQNSIKKWFAENCILPEMPSIIDAKKITAIRTQPRLRFIKEWNETLQLLRNIAARLRVYRPAWIDKDVPDGVHVDQFLHAYYYLVVRDGHRQPFDEYFERNKDDPDAALIEQMKWWQKGDYEYHQESNFIHNWAPSSHRLLARDKIGTLSEDEFAQLCTQVHAIRDHAIKQSNKILGLPGESALQDEKTEAFGRWLYGRTSVLHKTVLETITYVLYGGDPTGLPDRLWAATRDERWKIAHLGLSSFVSAQGTPSSSRRKKMLHYAETNSWRQGIDEKRATREQAGKAAVLTGAC